MYCRVPALSWASCKAFIRKHSMRLSGKPLTGIGLHQRNHSVARAEADVPRCRRPGRRGGRTESRDRYAPSKTERSKQREEVLRAHSTGARHLFSLLAKPSSRLLCLWRKCLTASYGDDRTLDKGKSSL